MRVFCVHADATGKWNKKVLQELNSCSIEGWFLNRNTESVRYELFMHEGQMCGALVLLPTSST